MNSNCLEHANLTVKNIDAVIQFITTALPTWAIRGQGSMDWFGKRIRWLHVGTATCYLALQDGGEGEGLKWTGHRVGMKHLGMVVPSLAAVTDRLAAAGYPMDHWGGTHPHRKSAYFTAEELQFEFVEYVSANERERNDYTI
jgi:hypothetical protein